MPAEPSLCPQCQAQVHPDWTFCTHCGSRQRSSPFNAYPHARETDLPACSNCGAALDTSGAFCWRCGVPVPTGRHPFIPANVEPGAGSGVDEESEAARYQHLRGRSRTREERGPTSRRTAIGGLVLIVGVALLLGSLWVGWYSVTARASATQEGTSVVVNGTGVYYPLNQYWLQLTCEGSPSCPSNLTQTSSYPQGTFDSVGTLYDIVAALVIGALVLGGSAGIIAAVSRRAGSKLVLGLALTAVILALLAPGVLMLAQPSVLSSQGPSGTGAGPSKTFFGSCSGGGCGATLVSGTSLNASWGPSLGWYLSLAGGAVLVVGFFLARKPRVKSEIAWVYESS